MESRRFRIGLLGSLSVRSPYDADNAPPITRFSTQKTAALLVLLALSPGRSFPREVIIDRLWPDASSDDGRRSLRVALAALRRVLEPVGTPSGAVLSANREAVSLRAEAVSTDVADFENAVRRGDGETARTVYASGPLLPAFYDDWVLRERERLEEMHERLPLSARRISVPGSPVMVAERQPIPLTPPINAPSPDSGARLPFYLTRFVGRETERETLAGLWDDAANRLITLTGTGGIGKTRFVVEAITSSPTEKTTRFVPLADATDSSAMVRQVAVSLEHDPAKANAQTIGHALSRLGPARLVLDNMEQLLTGAGDRAAAILVGWLAQCPGLQIVVTSRQRLNVPGEREFVMEPLTTPTLPATPERLLDFASVRLFLDRARMARSDAALTPRTADTVSRLCERLGGLPLALEITAAWAGALTFGQMLARVEEHLLDETGPPAAHRRAARPDRHRTLRAALHVSLEMLSPSLVQTFDDCAVFKGSFSAEATRFVFGDESGSHETLSRLRERSLLVSETDASGDSLRFRLLPTLYEFACERHEADGSRAALLADAHRHYFARLAETPRKDEIVLDADVENFRRAFETGKNRPDPALDLRLCAGLWSFWKVRGYAKEGLERIEAALENLSEAPPAQDAPLLQARHGAAALAFDLNRWDDSRRHHQVALLLAQSRGDAAATGRAYQGLTALAIHADADFSRAAELADAAQTQYQLAGDTTGEARILIARGVIANKSGDFATALELQRQSLVLAEADGDKQCIATAHHRMGNSLVRLGRYDEAEKQYADALTLFREIGNRMETAFVLSDAASIAHHKNNPAEAVAQYEEVLQILRLLGETWGMGVCLNNMGRLAADNGDFSRSVSCLSEALELREMLNDKHALLQSVDAVINLLLYATTPKNKPVRLPLASDAVRLRAADIALRARLGIGQATFDDEALSAITLGIRQLLGQKECARLETTGAKLTLDQTVGAARAALAKIL